MIQGAGTISNYGSYISNCTKGQMAYKIPVNLLTDIQLPLNIGFTKPDAVQYQLIHTCGPYKGEVETLTTTDYAIVQDYNNRWHGTFKNFSGNENPLTCFVIAITLVFAETERIYFSEEYCIDADCADELTLIQGCYGNMDSRLSFDCNGNYFGIHAGDDDAMGDLTVTYKHQMFLRNVEIALNSTRHTFSQGRTRTFRSERQRIYQFYSELIPEWYMPEVEGVFYRGEVIIGDTKYLLNETDFTKVEACKKIWKPGATFKDSCFQSFSCETDPCAAPVIECCNPTSLVASVEYVDTTVVCCDPQIINVYVEFDS